MKTTHLAGTRLLPSRDALTQRGPSHPGAQAPSPYGARWSDARRDSAQAATAASSSGSNGEEASWSGELVGPRAPSLWAPSPTPSWLVTPYCSHRDRLRMWMDIFGCLLGGGS